jgi:REP element-mobilizing transposase RayT
MSRKTPLLQIPGAVFHVFNRGVDRKAIFFDPQNYRYFEMRLRTALSRHGVILLCYCLMPNHFHLMLYQGRPRAVSFFMKDLCDGYVKAINRWETRTGHLLGGGYKMRHVDDRSYVLYLSRYIHRNPVDAGLVGSALHWEYSSCRHYCGTESKAWVEKERVLEAFGGNAGREYRGYVDGDAGMPTGGERVLFQE